MAGFGAKPAATGGFSFGTQGAGGAAASGFGFGQTQQPAANKTLFTTPASTAQPLGGGGGFNFGTLGAASTTSAASTTTASTFGFGTTATPAATTSAAGGFSFGATPTAGTVAPTGSSFSFGGAQQTGTPIATAAPAPAAVPVGFGIGGATATPASTPATTSFSFGLAGASAPVATAASTGFAFPGGLGGTQPQAPKTQGFGFGTGLQSTTTTTTSSVGLGGVSIGLGGAQPPSAIAGNNNVGAKTDGKSAKEQMLSTDLFATIGVFETRRDAENGASEENIRQTAAPFHKVSKKAEEIQQMLAELAGEYQQLHANAVTLKAEVLKEAEHVEMARRTKDTPMALQGENKAPEVYFTNLVRHFESEMMYCRTKIEEVSVCMQAASNPCESPDDIAEVLQREHDVLKELASKVYTKHSQLVELGHRLNTTAMPNDQGFFRPQSKNDSKTPTSAVIPPILGGRGSGLQAFQEQQQRAKAVTLGAAPPTMPLAQTTMPSMFGTNPNSSSLFSSSGSIFGTNNFGLGSQTANNSFGGSKSAFGAFGANTSGIQQQSAFSLSSPFNAKPFGS